ncbi:6906_t:CDS:1, partial [Funneliformis geosporum]
MANTFISIETFEEIISTYKASLKHNQRNIYLVSQDEYEDIKKALLSEQVQDTHFRKWARNHFCNINVGADHIVHVKLNERKEKATNNINKNIHSLPVLIRENMYRIFCSAHLDVSHKKLAGTYDKLR